MKNLNRSIANPRDLSKPLQSPWKENLRKKWNKSGDINSRKDGEKNDTPLTSTDLRSLIRSVDDEAVQLLRPIKEKCCCGLQRPLEGTGIDSSHALIGTSLSTICACLQVPDCVEQTLLFVPLKWTVQCEFMAVKK